MAQTHPVLQMLDTAESTWREAIKTEFPLFLDTPVVRAKPDPKNKRHWQFYTDLKTTHMDVFKPEMVETLFRDAVMPMYEAAYGTVEAPSPELLERLIHDNFTYLLFHEQFHPTFCPDSKTDEKLVDKALYEGIKAGDPRAQPQDILRKVGNVRNSAWDQVIDTAFFTLSNFGNSVEQRLEDVLANAGLPREELTHLPDAVVPIFDVMEFEVEKKAFPSLFYPLSRAVYGFLFTRQAELRGKLFDYFKQRITKQMPEKEFDQAIQEALKGFAGELTPEQLRFARLERDDFERDIEQLYRDYNNPQADAVHERVITTINSLLLDKRSRYDALRGFVKPLAKYISLQQEEKRHGTHIGNGSPGDGDGQPQPGQAGDEQNQPSQGNGDQQTGANQPGGNTEQALLNLADLLDQNEANGLLSAVANSPGGSQGGQAQKDKRLSNLARDEYYKKNTPEISIRSPNYEAVSVDVGKKEVPVYVGTRTLTTDEVAQLDLEQILLFQQKWGITQLSQLSEFQYKFDQYELHEVDETDYKFENTDLDLPDNVVFHVDSSGSMGSVQYVGTGQPYDILMHVCYGILKTVRKGAEEMKKPVNVVAVNFSNGSILSDAVEVGHMYDSPNNTAKQVLTGFQNGGTEYSADTFKHLEQRLKPGKTVHIWVTDGALNDGCQQSALQQIGSAIRQPDTSFLYFEIGSSSFGQQVNRLFQSHANAQYYPNVSLQTIKDKAVEVLLQYQ